MREAENLVKQGVREILVISQDTSAYGVDVRYKLDFVGGRAVRTKMTELVKELARLAQSSDAWVRLHYVYPYPHVDEIIPLMAEGRVLPYLDVPFQHSHPRVLKAMKRPASGEKNIERIRAWRAICPDLTIRSTFIAGFPGETEAEFEHLLDFLREAQLDRVGCFAYSPVEGAAANALPGQLARRGARGTARALHAGAGADLGPPARPQGRDGAARADRRSRPDGRAGSDGGRCPRDRRNRHGSHPKEACGG